MLYPEKDPFPERVDVVAAGPGPGGVPERTWVRPPGEEPGAGTRPPWGWGPLSPSWKRFAVSADLAPPLRLCSSHRAALSAFGPMGVSDHCGGA